MDWLMDSSRKQMIEEIANLSGQIWVKGRLREDDAWISSGLTIPQLRLLIMLAYGPKKMSEIAGGLGISLTSCTTLMDRVVDKQLAERTAHPSDRRVVLGRITPRGLALLGEFGRQAQLDFEDLSEFVTGDELVTVREAYRILLRAAELKATAPRSSEPADDTTGHQPPSGHSSAGEQSDA